MASLPKTETKSLSELSRKLGLREEAIRLFAERVKKHLGYPLNYPKLLDVLKTIKKWDHIPSYLLPREEAFLSAYEDIQYTEFGEEIGLEPNHLRLIAAGIIHHEVWVNRDNLIEIIEGLEKSNLSLDPKILLEYANDCWHNIKMNQRYGVPSRGKAEILVPPKFAHILKLKSLRFLKESAEPPEVFVRFEFQRPHAVGSAIGIIKIQDDGTTNGFHLKTQSESFRLLIDAIAFSYYRDLVTLDETYLYKPLRASTRWVRVHSDVPTSTKEQHKKPRHIPRLESSSESSYTTHSIREWYYAQERARHTVVGHIRWVDRNFVADSEKQIQARQSGVTLRPGYTWVVEHERGLSEVKGIKLRDFDLVERIIFAAPERASKELYSLIAQPKFQNK